MNAIIYARFSSSQQQDGTSIERQFDLAEAYAKKHGLHVTDRLADKAKSAFKAAHLKGQLGELLTKAKSGQLAGQTILVESIDRLSRQTVMQAFDQLRAFTSNNVTIITVSDGRVLNDATFEKEWTSIIEPLAKMAVAYDESKKKSDRATETWKIKRNASVYSARVPAWLNPDRTIKPAAAKVVREIFDMAAAGEGVVRIATILNAAEVETFGKKTATSTLSRWHPSSISRLLKNTAVLGHVQPKSGGQIAAPVLMNHYPAIISQDVFDKANQQVSTRKFGSTGSGRSNSSNLFKSIATCASCGSAMTKVSAPPMTFLRCTAARTHSCDNKRGFNYATFETAFLQHLREVKLDASRNDATAQLNAQLAEAKAALAAHTKNVDFWLDKMQDRDSPAITARFEREEEAAKQAKLAVADIEAKLKAAAKTIHDHHAEALDLLTHMNGLEDQSRFRTELAMLLRRMIRKMAFFNAHRVIVQLTNGTVYTFAYCYAKTGQPVPATKRATKNTFIWKVSRSTSHEIVAMSDANQAEAMKDPAIAEFWS